MDFGLIFQTLPGMSNQPSKWLLRFFRWFADPEIVDDIEGDLIESFQLRKAAHQLTRLWMFWEIIRLIRPGIVRPLFNYQKLNTISMISFHSKVAFRVLKRDKRYTAINILGLSLGIWCTLLTYLWLQDEYQFDRFHTNNEQLYRILMNIQINDLYHTEEASSYPLADALLAEYPEVEQAVRFVYPEKTILKIGEAEIETEYAATEPAFLDVFTFPLTHGDSKQALASKQNMVISQELAEAHFNGLSPIGQSIIMKQEGKELDFVVAGVMEKLPSHSSMQFDVLVPISYMNEVEVFAENWNNPWLTTYITLKDGTDPEVFKEKIKNFPFEKADAEWYTLNLQKYSDQYLFGQFEEGEAIGGRIDNLKLFALIASFTLIIAGFNYINLTTARSIRRDKEIGIKKTLGAYRSSIITQFLFETGTILIAALGLSLLFTYLSLPAFNQLTGKNVELSPNSLEITLVLGSIFLFTLVSSGLYPALSASNLGKSLKTSLASKQYDRPMLRRVLVTLQFALSIILVSGAAVVYQQIKYISDKDLGLDQVNVLLLELDEQSRASYADLKAAASSHTSILTAAISSHDFYGPLGYTSDVRWRLRPEDGDQLFFGIQDIDADMLPLLDLAMKEGTTFDTGRKEDATQYIINEAAAKSMGFENPVGEQLTFWGNTGTIIGVTKDFHFSTLHEQIQPLIMRHIIDANYLFIKTEKGKTKQAIDYLSEVHASHSQFPMKLSFMDQAIQKKYQEEQSMQKLAYSFAFMTLVISCLGMIGLISYSVERRTKEIAVRKVLGASIPQISRLLFSEYLIIIGAAAIIGVPSIYFWAQQWLNNYPYRTDLEVQTWLISLICILGLSLLISVAFMKRIDQTNPATTLRDE